MKRTSIYVHRSMKASILKTLMGQFDFGGEISEIRAENLKRNSRGGLGEAKAGVKERRAGKLLRGN
jgi:hypothetical protein